MIIDDDRLDETKRQNIMGICHGVWPTERKRIYKEPDALVSIKHRGSITRFNNQKETPNQQTTDFSNQDI